MRHTGVFGLSGSTIFFDIISYTTLLFFFGKRVMDHIMCVWYSLQLLFETFIILRKIQRDTVINVKKSSRQVPVILVVFY
jgi:hypothetical protein